MYSTFGDTKIRKLVVVDIIILAGKTITTEILVEIIDYLFYNLGIIQLIYYYYGFIVFCLLKRFIMKNLKMK
jgi:hypothetical protein